MKRIIAMLAVPGVQLLDVSGPLDVFAEANRVLKREVYESVVISLDSLSVNASSGVNLMAHHLLEQTSALHPDTFLLAGAPDIGLHSLTESQKMAVRRLCENSSRYGSICTGALLLAQTGLLNGRKVTTHWAASTLLSASFPQIAVDSDALYVADGPVRTAAGVTSGMDLAIRLVEEDLGRDIAQEIARNLVMFFRRPVNQGHFVQHKSISPSGRSAFQDMQRWALDNLASISTLKAMAEHIGLSTRHLNRLFHQEMNMTAGEWLEASRIDKAKTLLENGSLPMKSIASQCGYSGGDVMRRAFVKRVGLTPAVFRRLNFKE